MLKTFSKEGYLQNIEIPPQEHPEDSASIEAGKVIVQMTSIATRLAFVY